MSNIVEKVRFNTMTYSEAKEHGFSFFEKVAFSDTRVVAVNRIGLKPSIEAWVEEQCADRAMLCRNDKAFGIAFRDSTDATLFRVRFA